MDGVRRFGAMHLTPEHAGGDDRSVPRQLQRQGPPGRHGQPQEQADSPTRWRKLLDGPPAMRTWLIRKLIMEGFTLEDLMRDDEAAGGVRAQGGGRGLACVLHLPDGLR